jgi:hypothetical protein
MIPRAAHVIGRWQPLIEKVKSRSSSVNGLAGVLTDDSHGDASQLRDSDGFAPLFPRFHQQLFTAETRNFTLRAAETFAMNTFQVLAHPLHSFITYRCGMYSQGFWFGTHNFPIQVLLSRCCEFKATLSC